MKRSLLVLLVVVIMVWVATATTLANPITASFSRTELRFALSLCAELAGSQVVVDQNVNGTVTLELREDSLEDAFSKLLMGTPYTYVYIDGIYVVGFIDPRSVYFPLVSVTNVFDLRYIAPDTMARQLEGYPASFRYHPGRSLLTVTALPMVMKEIEAEILALDNRDQPHQVAYTVDVIEISENAGRNLELESFVAERSVSLSSLLRFVASPSVASVIQLAPKLAMTLEGGVVEEQKKLAASPQIVTAFGKTGRMRIVEETLTVQDTVQKELAGFELAVTPIRIGKEFDGILSTVLFRAGEGTAAFNTEVWVPSDQPVLIGLLEKGSKKEHSSGNQAENRYFAIYLSGKPVSSLGGGGYFPAGSLVGLKDFLWPETTVPKGSYLEVTYGPNDRGLPDFEASVWITDNCLVESRIYQGSESRFQIDMYTALTKHEIRVGMNVLNTPEAGTNIGLGISDVVHLSENLTLSAGIYPIVYSTETNELVKPSWYFEAAAQGAKTNATVGCRYEQDKPLLYGSAGFSVLEDLSLIVGYRLHDHGSRFLVGVRWTFGK